MLKVFWLDWWKWSNGMSARILQTFTRLFEEVRFCRVGPWTMVEQKISVPILGQMDHSDMWLLTFLWKICSENLFLSYESETKDAVTGAPLIIILNFPRKCQSASMTWARKAWPHKSVGSKNLTICSESHPFWFPSMCSIHSHLPDRIPHKCLLTTYNYA